MELSTTLIALLLAWFLYKGIPVLKSLLVLRHHAGFPAAPFGLLGRLVQPSKLNYQSLSSWKAKFDYYAQHGSTALFLPSLFSRNLTLLVADAGAIKTIVNHPVSFAKPLRVYKLVGHFGTNLVASDGVGWRRHRRVVAPTFSEANNRIVFKDSLQACDEWIAHVNSDLDAGGAHSCDVHETMMRLTLMVISSSGFGRPLSWADSIDKAAPDDKHQHSFVDALEGTMLFGNQIVKALFPSWAFKLPVKKLKLADSLFTEFVDYLVDMIAERREERAAGIERDDLFSALVRASKMEEDSAALSQTELLSNMHIFFFAETSANTLSAAFMLLALHPEHQAAIYEESTAVLGTDLSPSYHDFGQLRIATATFYEALRLFPAVATIPKVAVADTSLVVHTLSSKSGEPAKPTQIFVPAGTNVRIDVAGLHYNPMYWEDPYTFNPSRFLDTPEHKWNRDAFLSFSAGSRACIGKVFALIEATVILSKILLHFEIAFPEELVEEYKLKEGETERERRDRIYKPTHGVTLTPHDVKITFIPRKQSGS